MNSIEQEHLLAMWQEWHVHKHEPARERLIQACMPLVERIAQHFFSSSYLDQQDIRSIGMIGLLDAIERYDPQRATKFETYASWRIRGAILDEIRRMDWVPRKKREQAKQLERAFLELQQHHLSHITDEEVAAYMHISVQEYQELLAEISNFSWISLEAASDLTTRDEGQRSLLEVLADDQVQEFSDRVHQQEIATLLAQSIDRLPEKERLVLSLYYYEECPPKEIAKVLNLSSSRISQLHAKAIYRMRGMLGRRKREILDQEG